MLSATTPGDYTTLNLDVSKDNSVPKGTTVTFTLNFGVAYVDTPTTMAILEIKFGCDNDSIKLDNVIPDITVNLGDPASTGHTLPGYTLDESTPGCWPGLTFTITEKTSNPTMGL